MLSQEFHHHLRSVLRHQWEKRLKVKLLLSGGFEISGHVLVMADWVEVFKDEPTAEDDAEQRQAFAHVGLGHIIAFELIES